MKKLLFLLGAGCMLACVSCSPKDEETEKRPNILFVLADDQRNDVLSCAGHPVVQTPTIDRLAAAGTRFTKAFVTTSICAASRASIFTGLYESSHQYTFGQPPLKRNLMEKSYPYLLRKAGYITGFVGKLGVAMEARDEMLNQMFDHYELSPRNAPYVEELPDGTRMHSAEIKGQQAIAFIQKQTAEKPFCLSVSFNAVHAVDANKTPGNAGHYPYPDEVSHLYENVEMPLPLLSDSSIYNQHPDFLKQSLNRERYFWRWDTYEKYQTNMRAYFRMISGYDRVINRIIEALEAKGLADNTIIIYTADNGYYMGNRGFAGKWSHYEESLRVPMIIYDPRLPDRQRGKESEEMVLNIDIAATLLDYAGLNPESMYQGKSMQPLVEGRAPENWRKDFLCEHRMKHDKIPQYVGVRGERFVYASYYNQTPPYEYLHDLTSDPLQLVNFADSSAYSEQLQRMRVRAMALEAEFTSIQ